jgi:hypothetical protein|tara:strand:+ start:386 stop:544 length:159 start_codon:yes stop_codon:yes gene_type:complete
MEFIEWFELGRAKGWCSELTCSTHDMLPMSEPEIEAWEAGEEPCLFGVRVYT